MAKRMIDISRFLDATPEPIETPAERRQRISSALERAAETKGMIIENRRENDRLIRNHRKTKSDLFLDMRDLMSGIGPSSFSTTDQLLPEERAILAGHNPRVAGQMLTEQFPTAQDDMIMQEYYQPKPQPQQQPQRQMLMEDVPAKPRLNLRQPVHAPAAENWYVKKFLGETRGGDTVQIWKVTNKKTGTAIDKMFRLEGVANRIAMLLNESGGDMYDPRVVSLITVYDKRDQLLKEARALEKTASGKPMKTERLRAIRGEINQLDYRLGL